MILISHFSGGLVLWAWIGSNTTYGSCQKHLEGGSLFLGGVHAIFNIFSSILFILGGVQGHLYILGWVLNFVAWFRGGMCSLQQI